MYTVVNDRVRVSVTLLSTQADLWARDAGFRARHRAMLVDRHAAADEIVLRTPGGHAIDWIQVCEEPTLRMRPEEINPYRGASKLGRAGSRADRYPEIPPPPASPKPSIAWRLLDLVRSLFPW